MAPYMNKTLPCIIPTYEEIRDTEPVMVCDSAWYESASYHMYDTLGRCWEQESSSIRPPTPITHHPARQGHCSPRETDLVPAAYLHMHPKQGIHTETYVIGSRQGTIHIPLSYDWPIVLVGGKQLGSYLISLLHRS